ncbi:MAG: MlaD family protein, partial [Desulfobacterales bacterium]
FTLTLIVALILFGCGETTYNFKIQFEDIHGLRNDDQVFFDKSPIGNVTDVEYTDSGNYLVSVAVEDKFSTLLKNSSTFYIDSNPETGGQQAVRIIQAEDGGHKLETDILPRIKEQIEELRRRLQQIGREEKLKYVDRKIEAISEKL